MAKVYRYYVEVLLEITRNGERRPMAICLDGKVEKITGVLAHDKKWSRSHEYCEHYFITTHRRKLDLYFDGWNRWYVELEDFFPHLFSYQDLIRYGLLKEK